MAVIFHNVAELSVVEVSSRFQAYQIQQMLVLLSPVSISQAEVQLFEVTAVNQTIVILVHQSESFHVVLIEQIRRLVSSKEFDKLKICVIHVLLDITKTYFLHWKSHECYLKLDGEMES